MKKADDWKGRLDAYLIEQQEVPFEWGVNDCCSFVGGALEAMTGENPYTEFMDDLGHPYSDEWTGRAFMNRKGGLAMILVGLFGRHKREGEPGDVAYGAFPDGSAVGIHAGDHAVFKSEDGLVVVELSKCRFFRVP